MPYDAVMTSSSMHWVYCSAFLFLLVYKDRKNRSRNARVTVGYSRKQSGTKTVARFYGSRCMCVINDCTGRIKKQPLQLLLISAVRANFW